MRYYLVYISSEYVAKNRLHKDINAFMLSVDRLFIEENEVKQFMRKIEIKINDLNKMHPRCKPVKISWCRGFLRMKEDFHLHHCPTVSLSLLKTK